MQQKRYQKLCLILGDQLNAKHSLFEKIDKNRLFLMLELEEESQYVQHHLQKILAFFTAMRLFAQELRAQGHELLYIRIGSPESKRSLEENIQLVVETYGIEAFFYQEPDEYRLQTKLHALEKQLAIASYRLSTEHFYCSREDIEREFQGGNYLMERFYRTMRKREGILLDEANKPLGGKWNFDHSNRKNYKGKEALPMRPDFGRDISPLIAELEAAGIQSIGRVEGNILIWPCSRSEALQALIFFCEELLPFFGKYQDAMQGNSPFLFHSLLSFALNVKLLSPKEVVDAALAAWQANPEGIELSSLEGFIRQILGWREYMRAIYWKEMPDYAQKNFFGHNNELPNWFWTGKTKMNCLSKSIKQSLDFAYAHHIQRLMVTGNFALLAGINPDAVDAWYLGIYIDAIEWVEITNTRGMSQFADGGIVGSKPYCSSANYINKMSDYCGSCSYDKKARTGPKACPFNSLYWHFHARHRKLLEKNPRIGMVYRLWDKMPEAERTAVLARAEELLEQIEGL